MANPYWLGGAVPVAQVTTVQITGFDVATTYTITVGAGNRTSTVSVIGTTDADGTASALNTAWNAVTGDIYVTTITSSVATDTVTFTADTSGAPFIIASSVTGGTGTIGAATTTTASAGPNDWSTVGNWSTGAVPVSTDDVVIANSSDEICWGLDQNAVALDSLAIHASFSGRIGLPDLTFATSSDGVTQSSTRAEYREDYLRIGAESIQIGLDRAGNTSSGATRIKIDNTDAAASTLECLKTALTSADSGLPAVRYLVAHASSSVVVREATGGFGVAVDAAGETSTLASIDVTATSSAAFVRVGNGVTLTNWAQQEGTHTLESAVTGAMTIHGGTTTTIGSFVLGTVTALGGTLDSRNRNGSNVAITALTFEGGTVAFGGTRSTRTVTTLNWSGGGTITGGDYVTFGTTNLPTAGDWSLTAALT